MRIHNVATKWQVDIKYKYIESSFQQKLKYVYDLHSEFMFVAFPTTSSWDGLFFECVWLGNFDFYRYSDDAIGAGYSGKIRLMETPS